MPRETVKSDVPIEWRRRYKAGLCPVCAKIPEEFDKGQKVFCSVKCREEYASKYMDWNDLKEQAFKKYGRKCAKCKTTDDKLGEKRTAAEKELVSRYIENHRAEIDAERDRLLVRWDEHYRNEFDKIGDDAYVAKNMMSWEERKVNLPYYVQFDVDHKIAIVNGGDMWDINNLQVLCSECHKEKTKKDLGERTINKIKSKHKTLEV